MNEPDSRRAFLSIAGAGVLLAACGKDEGATREPTAATARSAPSATTDAGHTPKEEKDDEVSATEDLMREHGVIRRVLVVYREAATRLRNKSASLPPDALQKVATLMRSFGEDYHEKQLEEVNIFPVLMKRGGPLVGTVSTLIAQHQRGREITEYVLAATRKTIGAQAVEPLARALEGFARMYEEHAAIEDTIVFPAWKKALTPKELDEMGERFEDIEHKTFGKNGFEDAVDQVGAIEESLGIVLATLTAPPPKS
jgi:hemerythrin-like domain-containing protein